MPSSHSITTRQNGFSLLEISIVLTIISLLVGGLVIGQNMIRSADIQATVGKVEEYTSAIHKFRDRFYELPGDYSTATTNWTGVSNGNGNGKIGGLAAFSINTDCDATGNWAEQWNAWMHMAKAELIAGEYSSTGTSTLTIGTNVPAGAIRKSGYTIRFCGEIKTSAIYFASQYAHVIQLGSATDASTAGTTRQGIFSTKEAAAIDTKLDDAYPHTGKIMAPKKNATLTASCTDSTANAPATADYDFTNSAKDACPLFFKLGF